MRFVFCICINNFCYSNKLAKTASILETAIGLYLFCPRKIKNIPAKKNFN